MTFDHSGFSERLQINVSGNVCHYDEDAGFIVLILASRFFSDLGRIKKKLPDVGSESNTQRPLEKSSDFEQTNLRRHGHGESELSF